jgi:hypothetical protein
MKKILLLLLAITSWGCKSQTLDERMQQRELKENWFKDTENIFNTFEGTYVYNDGTKMLKVVLQKKLQSDKYNGDVLIGEYQYVENGVEKFNTLSRLNIPYTDKSTYNIDVQDIFKGKSIHCRYCASDAITVYGSISYPTVDNYIFGTASVKRLTVNGKAAIELVFGWETFGTRNPEDPLTPLPALEPGYYTLIKQ